jgi:hypothetical protein
MPAPLEGSTTIFSPMITSPFTSPGASDIPGIIARKSVRVAMCRPMQMAFAVTHPSISLGS